MRLGSLAMVVKGACAQDVLRGKRQRVDPVPMPLQHPHQVAILQRSPLVQQP